MQTYQKRAPRARNALPTTLTLTPGWCEHGPECTSPRCRLRLFNAGKSMPPRQDPSNKRWKPKNKLWRPCRVTASTRPELLEKPCPKIAHCVECQCDFEAPRADSKYCSGKCRQKAYRRRGRTA
jgi:hypothetical protein